MQYRTFRREPPLCTHALMRTYALIRHLCPLLWEIWLLPIASTVWLWSERSVVPCPNCAWVCFALLLHSNSKIRCRDEALASSYHRYECAVVLKLLIESGLNIYSSLSLRAVCTSPQSPNGDRPQRWRWKDEKMTKKNGAVHITNHIEGGNVDEDFVYATNDFSNLINLCAQEHRIFCPVQWGFRFLRTFIACFLLKMLMATTFFDASSDWPWTEFSSQSPTFFRKVLLQLLNICPFNSHVKMSEIESPAGRSVNSLPPPATTKCGSGPPFSRHCTSSHIFNHSCTP